MSMTYSIATLIDNRTMCMSGYWEDLGDAQQYVSQEVSLNRIARLRNERELHFVYSQ